MKTLYGITLLLFYQLLGETLVLLLALPVPGPVAGMAMLFLTLMLRRSVPVSVNSTATALLQHLSLLFIPAGVGVIVHFQRVGDEGLALGAALVISTILTLVTTALTMKGLARLLPKRVPKDGGI